VGQAHGAGSNGERAHGAAAWTMNGPSAGKATLGQRARHATVTRDGRCALELLAWPPGVKTRRKRGAIGRSRSERVCVGGRPRGGETYRFLASYPFQNPLMRTTVHPVQLKFTHTQGSFLQTSLPPCGFQL